MQLLFKKFNNIPIAHLWSLLFIAPILQLFFSDYSSIRNYAYGWVTWFIFWLWHNREKINNTSFISNKQLLVFIATIAFSFNFSFISRYYAYTVPASDFGIFQSLLDSMLSGDIGYSSVVGYYHFGTHQNYILFLVLPFYYFFHSALTLQIIAACVILLTAIVIFLIAREYKLNKNICFFILVAYCLSPMNGLDNNFGPETFMPLFFLVTFLGYKRNNLFCCLFFLLLALSTKEDAVLYTFGFGILALYNKRYRYAFWAITLSLIVFYVNLAIVQPYFVQKSGMLNPITLNYWSQWGKTKSEIVYNLISHPFQVIYSIIEPNSGIYRLYLPFLFTTLLIPEVWLPSILYILLAGTANTTLMHTYHAYYAMTLNAINYIGIIILITKFKYKSHLQFSLLVMLFVTTLLGTGYQAFYYFNRDMIQSVSKLITIVDNNYKSTPLCLENTLSPILRPYNFNIPPESCCNNMNLATVHNCTIVISKYGHPTKTWQQLRADIIATHDCKNFDGFLFCSEIIK